MGLFDEAGPNHPIYHSGSFIQAGATPPTPPPASIADVVAQAPVNAEADPLAGSQNKDEWPMFLAANAGEGDAAWTLLPATIAAFASTLEAPPATDEVVWLEPAWLVNLGDVEGVAEVLVTVRDGFSGEVGADLFALSLDNGYRVYYERVADTVANFGGPPLIRGFVKEDKSSPDGHDRQAVERSLRDGYLSDASAALDANFEGVAHEAWGTFADLFE